MKNEIKYALYLIGLGVSIIAYANSQFVTKDEHQMVKSTVEKMDSRIYEIWKEVVKK